MRLELGGARDALAVRLAVAACRAPLRLERLGGRRALVVDPADLDRAQAAFLRAGLCARAAAPWPEARPATRGVLVADGARWCVGRVPVDETPRRCDAVLLLSPVPRDDALRALAARLGARLRRPFARRPRPLAVVAARIARGEDGVVAARAYVLGAGGTDEEAIRAIAPARAARLRVGALEAWRDIAAPRGGVWRSLQALEGWWS